MEKYLHLKQQDKSELTDLETHERIGKGTSDN